MSFLRLRCRRCAGDLARFADTGSRATQTAILRVALAHLEATGHVAHLEPATS